MITPTSTISNIYFDYWKILMSFKMPNTAVKNSDADLYRKSQVDSPVFLEVE